MPKDKNPTRKIQRAKPFLAILLKSSWKGSYLCYVLQ